MCWSPPPCSLRRALPLSPGRGGRAARSHRRLGRASHVQPSREAHRPRPRPCSSLRSSPRSPGRASRAAPSRRGSPHLPRSPDHGAARPRRRQEHAARSRRAFTPARSPRSRRAARPPRTVVEPDAHAGLPRVEPFATTPRAAYRPSPSRHTARAARRRQARTPPPPMAPPPARTRTPHALVPPSLASSLQAPAPRQPPARHRAGRARVHLLWRHRARRHWRRVQLDRPCSCRRQHRPVDRVS